MKHMFRAVCVLSTIGALLLAACGGATATSAPIPSATIGLAQATPTDTPQPTSTAVPSSPTPGVTPTATPMVDYTTLTEEELAAIIDQAVAEAMAASEAASTATTQATSDDAVTQEELAALEALVAEAEATLDAAFAVLDAYYDLYGDLAEETLAVLTAIENDLNALVASTEALVQLLDEIDQTLQQGLALAQETIDQLESAAQQAGATLDDLQTQAQTWLTTLQGELADRADKALETQPTDVARDRIGAIRSGFAYLDSVKTALADGRVVKDELSAIAQAGANASASLKARGGAELQSLADSIDALTAQLARGELPQAKVSLDSLEQLMPPRP